MSRPCGDKKLWLDTSKPVYVSDSGLHLSPHCARLSVPVAPASGHYTTERMTNFCTRKTIDTTE